MTKYQDLIDEAKAELEEEDKRMAIAEIKERLREIREGEAILGKLRRKLQNLLDMDVLGLDESGDNDDG